MAEHARLKNEFSEDEKCHNHKSMFMIKNECRFPAEVRLVKCQHLINKYSRMLDKGMDNRLVIVTNEPRHDKTNKVAVRPAKTQISLGIRLV